MVHSDQSTHLLDMQGSFGVEGGGPGAGGEPYKPVQPVSGTAASAAGGVLRGGQGALLSLTRSAPVEGKANMDFLASDEVAFVQGAALRVDAGQMDRL